MSTLLFTGESSTMILYYKKILRYFFLPFLSVLISATPVNRIEIGLLYLYDHNAQSNKSSRSNMILNTLTKSLSAFSYLRVIQLTYDNLKTNEYIDKSKIKSTNFLKKIGASKKIQLIISGVIKDNAITLYLFDVKRKTYIKPAITYSFSDIALLSNKLAYTIETSLARKSLKELRNDSPKLKLDFWAQKKKSSNKIRPSQRGKIRIGESIVFNIISDKSGYLTLVDIQPNGDMIVLFPNAAYPGNRIQANTRYTIPGTDDDFEIRATHPVGRDTIVAYFSKRRVEWFSQLRKNDQPFWSINNGKKYFAARGIKIVAERLDKDEWESKTIEIDVVE